jgi:hypothetical protein
MCNSSPFQRLLNEVRGENKGDIIERDQQANLPQARPYGITKPRYRKEGE